MCTIGEIIIDREVRCPRGKPPAPSRCRFIFFAAELRMACGGYQTWVLQRQSSDLLHELWHEIKRQAVHWFCYLYDSLFRWLMALFQLQAINLKAPCILYIGQTYRSSPEYSFYIFNQQIYSIIFSDFHHLRLFLHKMSCISWCYPSWFIKYSHFT